MTKRVSTDIRCDCCGKRILGDYLEVTVDFGMCTHTFQVHTPRTSALDPCGNNLLKKLKELFPKTKENISHYD